MNYYRTNIKQYQITHRNNPRYFLNSSTQKPHYNFINTRNRLNLTFNMKQEKPKTQKPPQNRHDDWGLKKTIIQDPFFFSFLFSLVLPLLKPILDSWALMLKRRPSQRISELEVKLIKLPIYESAEGGDEDEDLGAGVADDAMAMANGLSLRTSDF